MSKITVVDLGMNNLLSICRALEYSDAKVSKTDDYKMIARSNKIVLPGVGAFGEAMKNINRLKLAETIKGLAEDNVPIMGICLGMQLFLDTSDEFSKNKGLGLIPGKNISLPKFSNLLHTKVPSVGWFKLIKNEDILEDDLFLLDENYKKQYYFVHSYQAIPNDSKNCLGYYLHGNTKVAAFIKKKNTVGFQFHPEKSGPVGLKILRRFINL